MVAATGRPPNASRAIRCEYSLPRAQRGRPVDLPTLREQRRLVELDRLLDPAEVGRVFTGAREQPGVGGEALQTCLRDAERGRVIRNLVLLVAAQRVPEIDITVGARMIDDRVGELREVLVLAEPVEVREVRGELVDPRACQRIRDQSRRREDVVVRAHERHRCAVLVDRFGDRALPLLEQRDVAIDEPRHRQREHRRLQQRDRLRALRI